MTVANRRKNSVRYNLRKKNKSQRVRLTVLRTNQHIYAQLIDDNAGVTLASSSTLNKVVASGLKCKSNVAAASKVGAAIASEAVKLGIKQIVFDRGGYLYHGRVKALADAARVGGLDF
jgi:large subunit ribosomal protein L18